MSSSISESNMTTWRCAEERTVQYRDDEDHSACTETTVGYRVLSLRQGHEAGQPRIEEQAPEVRRTRTAILVFHAMGSDSNVIELFAPFKQDRGAAPGSVKFGGCSTDSDFAAASSAGSGLGRADGGMHTSFQPSSDLVVIAVDRPGLGRTSPEGTNLVSSPSNSVASPSRSSQTDAAVKRHLNLHARNCVVALQQESPDQLFVYGCCLGHAYAVVFLRHFLQLQGQMKARSLPDLRGVALNVPYPSPAVPNGFGLARFANKYVPTSVLSGVACVGQSFFKPLMQFSFCNSTAKMLKTVLAKEEKELFATSVGSASGDEVCHSRYDFEQNGRVLDVMGVEGGKDTQKALEVSTSVAWQEDCVLLAKELKGHAEAFARQEGAGDRGEGRSFFTVFGSSEKDQLTPGRAVRWLVTDVYAELGCDYEETAPCSSHQLMVMGGGPVWNAPVHEKLLREKWGLI